MKRKVIFDVKEFTYTHNVGTGIYNLYIHDQITKKRENLSRINFEIQLKDLLMENYKLISTMNFIASYLPDMKCAYDKL